MQKSIYVNSIASISALGSDSKEVWESINSEGPKFQTYKNSNIPVSALSETQNHQLEELSHHHKRYNTLDRTALMAIAVGRNLIKTRRDWRSIWYSYP